MLKSLITNVFAKKGIRDLNAKIPGAPNFTYGEFIKSHTATRFGIDNIPKLEKTWNKIEDLAVNVIQPVRNEFGPIRITSGFRCAKLNKKINSSSSSNHIKGEAADIEPVEHEVKLINILEFIHDNLEFRNLIAEFFPSGWCHVDYREGNNIRRLKLKDATHNYEIITINELKILYR